MWIPLSSIVHSYLIFFSFLFMVQQTNKLLLHKEMVERAKLYHHKHNVETIDLFRHPLIHFFHQWQKSPRHVWFRISINSLFLKVQETRTLRLWIWLKSSELSLFSIVFYFLKYFLNNIWYSFLDIKSNWKKLIF